MRAIIMLCLALLLVAFSTPVPPPAAVPVVLPIPSPTMRHAQRSEHDVAAAGRQGYASDSSPCVFACPYDPSLRLLRESPIVAPDRHWLATDNQLTFYALAAAGDELAPCLPNRLLRTGAAST